MPESRKSLNVKKIEECEREASIYNPKKTMLFSIIAFLSAFLIARTLVTLQRAGIVDESPLIFLGFHLHHWAFSLIILTVLIPFAFYFRNNGEVFAILIIVIFFFLGLFLDGIVYPDAVIFFE